MYALGSDPMLRLPQGQQRCRGCCCLWSLGGVSGTSNTGPQKYCLLANMDELLGKTELSGLLSS